MTGNRSLHRKIGERIALRWSFATDLAVLAIAGLTAAGTYVLATAAGGLIDSSYSQVAGHVSDLTASSAPTAPALIPAYLLYDVASAVFAVVLYRGVGPRLSSRVGLWLLLINALAGVMMVTLFREDPGGTPVTLAGKGHVAWAAVSSVAVVGGCTSFGLAFRRAIAWRPLAIFSFVIAAAFVVAAPFAIITTATSSGLAGLAEKAAIGPFIAWLVVIAVQAGRMSHAQTASHHRPRVA